MRIYEPSWVCRLARANDGTLRKLAPTTEPSMSLPTKPQAQSARVQKPSVLPARPYFSSGPCPKRPGWSATALAERAFLGRSHRAADPKKQLKSVIDKMSRILGVPEGYKVGIVPAVRHQVPGFRMLTGLLTIALVLRFAMRPLPRSRRIWIGRSSMS